MITVIANEAVRQNDIADRTGLDRSIFSKSGFTKGLKELAQEGQAVLIDLQQIYEDNGL